MTLLCYLTYFVLVFTIFRWFLSDKVKREDLASYQFNNLCIYHYHRCSSHYYYLYQIKNHIYIQLYFILREKILLGILCRVYLGNIFSIYRRFGSEKVKKEFLEPSVAGDFVACLGVSEPGGGKNLIFNLFVFDILFIPTL